MGFGKISSNEVIPADIKHSISVAVDVDVFIFQPPIGSIIKGYYHLFLVLNLNKNNFLKLKLVIYLLRNLIKVTRYFFFYINI